MEIEKLKSDLTEENKNMPELEFDLKEFVENEQFCPFNNVLFDLLEGNVKNKEILSELYSLYQEVNFKFSLDNNSFSKNVISELNRQYLMEEYQSIAPLYFLCFSDSELIGKYSKIINQLIQRASRIRFREVKKELIDKLQSSSSENFYDGLLINSKILNFEGILKTFNTFNNIPDNVINRIKPIEVHKRELKCFFPIKIEQLNHIEYDGILTPNDRNSRKESLSKNYLTVLDASSDVEDTMRFLGIKRKLKRFTSPFLKHFKTNKEVDNDAINFLREYTRSQYYTFIKMDVDDEGRNKFYSSYCGDKLDKYFENIYEPKGKEYFWFNKDKNEYSIEDIKIKTIFLELCHDGLSFRIFDDFISKEFFSMLIYVSSWNGYDLGEYPYLTIGIIDDTKMERESYKFIQLFHSKLTKNERLPDYISFNNKLKEHIVQSFILSQLPITKEIFIPIIFELEGIYKLFSQLKRDIKKMTAAIYLNKKLKDYLETSETLSYFDVYKFIIERSSISKETLIDGTYKEAKRIFLKEDNYQEEQKMIIKIIKMNYKEREDFEKECEKEFKDIEALLKEQVD